ncbi:hypothetical protein ACFY8O_24040 [Streptomyces argenteolus]|uniref:Uncharacterized protein n=1 Tax=Streptomyces argenteolus TaxID=67274 RepID=A0ABW6XAA6_9ACTN
MTCGVLPAVERWLPAHLTGIADPENVKTITLFATGASSLGYGRAPGGATSRPGSDGSPPKKSRTRPFLQWLGERNTTLAFCGQLDIDAWYAENTEPAAPACEPFSTGPCRAATADAPFPSPR